MALWKETVTDISQDKYSWNKSYFKIHRNYVKNDISIQKMIDLHRHFSMVLTKDCRGVMLKKPHNCFVWHLQESQGKYFEIEIFLKNNVLDD